MKKILPVIIIMLNLPLLSSACDTCCCSVDDRYTSILPDFRDHVMGLRYRYNSLYSQVNAGSSITSALVQYNTVELWVGWNITRKIRIMGSVPYKFEALNNQAATKFKNGWGDISLLGYYELLNNRRTIDSERSLVHNLWFGVGAELPTGKYDTGDKTMLSGNPYQLGSGSTDVIFNVVYDLNLRNVELNGSSIYKINTVNKYGYEYGNYFNVKVQAYYKLCIKPTIIVAPDIGVQFENFQHSVDNEKWDETGMGNLLTGTVGVETNFKRIALGGNFQIPLQQSLGKGLLEANNTYIIHVSFML